MGLVAALWGVGGFAALLGFAVYRLMPNALDAFSDGLQWQQWVAAVASIVVTAYFEGYRGFQKGLSPRLAARAQHLRRRPSLLRSVLAPLYCAGYFHAAKRRVLSAYSLTAMIVVFVLLVRLLDQPWRGIVDAGVVVGLTWGLVATLIFGGRVLVRHGPDPGGPS
jgi:vacuolar-type H+-ATPase subunit I/STV1